MIIGMLIVLVLVLLARAPGQRLTLSSYVVADLLNSARGVPAYLDQLDERQLRRVMLRFWTLYLKVRERVYVVPRHQQREVEQQLSAAAGLARAQLRVLTGRTEAAIAGAEFDVLCAEACIGGGWTGEWQEAA